MNKIELRDYQALGFSEIRVAFRADLSPTLYVLPTGGGKCLGAGTPVLMYDGAVKRVEDVHVDDCLMGPDSRPRRVLSITRGREPLYRVTPVKGDAYVVNESHILSLKRTTTSARPKYPSQHGGAVVNVGVREYLASSATFKHTHKGWRAAVDFRPPTTLTLIEPYFLGLWLGDGHAHLAAVTTGDEEVVQYLIDYAKRIGMKLGWHDNSAQSITVKLQTQQHMGRGGTPVMNALRGYDLVRNKHIPPRFKTGSRAERLELLAGLIDSDGSYNGKGYDVTLGSEKLLDDLIFVARSLGFSAYKAPSRKTCHNNGAAGDYWRCSISGDVDRIPCRIERKKAAPRRQKKDVLVTGITVEPIGEGDYFGFEINGDHLFMLGDFTVTHNTYTFSAIAASAAERNNRVCIIVHRKELLLQASQSLTDLGIEHGLISPFFSPEPYRLIQVASVDTLLQRLKRFGGALPAWMRFNLVVFDEAHHVVDGNKWGRCFEQLSAPLKHGGEPVVPKMLGVTATPVRSDGKGLGAHAGGVFKTMVLGPSVADLIGRGMLVNPLVYTSLDQPDLSDLKTNKDGEYNLQELAVKVDKPRITGDAVEHYRTICPGAKAIAFCASIEHAKHVRDAFNEAGYRFELLVGAPEMSDAERTAVNKRLRSGAIDGACTVDLVSEGYDLPGLEVCIMLRPTASEALFLQQVGRVMRPSETKRGCWLLDHVGNVGKTLDGEFKRKHGLPSEAREWTLDGRKKKKGKAKEVELTIEMKQCPKCFVVHAPADFCPVCGYEYPAAGKKPPEQVDGTLTLVTDDIAAQAAAKRAQVSAQAQARTVEDMMEKLGYPRKRAEAIYEHRIKKEAARKALFDDVLAFQKESGVTPIRVLGVYAADMGRHKPKELQALRARFEHFAGIWRRARAGGDDPALAVQLDTILNPAGNPHESLL